MNAKQELLEHIKDRDVEFVSIALCHGYKNPIHIKGTLSEVLPLLDVNYDSGFGGQELFGFVWYTDGTWSDRGEYDGSEWWQHQSRPEHTVEIACF